jgi:hypothetical protein
MSNSTLDVLRILHSQEVGMAIVIGRVKDPPGFTVYS